MRIGARNSRFHARIEVERMFLTPVNARFGSAACLAGMSSGAIDSWEQKVSDKFGKHQIEQIVVTLRLAAKRAEVLADDSRETFEPSRPRPTGMNELRRILEGQIASIDSM